MGGVPRFGRAMTSAAEELTQAPEGKLLGTLDPSTITKRATFEEDGPPPWETDPKWTRDNTNARRFVDVPEHWELRWLSPRQIDHAGLRDWQVMAANDDRVKVFNRSMIAPDNTIRKGGHDGMILAFMPKTWVESRRRLKNERVDRVSQSSIDKQREVSERVNRGEFGPKVHVDSFKHPTHTTGDGRTMTDS